MSRRYRVLHVIDSLGLGGAQSVLINLLRYADRSLFELDVATMSGRGVYWDRVQALGVPVRSLSFSRAVPVYVPSMIITCLKRRYDIVHTHLIGANVIAKPKSISPERGQVVAQDSRAHQGPAFVEPHLHLRNQLQERLKAAPSAVSVRSIRATRTRLHVFLRSPNA